MKTAAAATPSYHSGWSLAHGRMAAADAERSAWLDAKLAADPITGRGASNRTAEQKQRIRDGMRRWRAKQPVRPPPGPCVVCGRPKRGYKGTKCRYCDDHDLCRCGGVKHRKAALCAQCRRWL